MYLFRKIATWYQGLGNVSSATPLALCCTFSHATRNYSTAVKLCLFRKNQRFPIRGSPVTYSTTHSCASILNPPIYEYSLVKFIEN